jgi:hypothetical protein
MASSATLLIWGMLRYPEAWKAVGQLDKAKEAVKWALDYFVKTHTAPKELYVQVRAERGRWAGCGKGLTPVCVDVWEMTRVGVWKMFGLCRLRTRPTTATG